MFFFTFFSKFFSSLKFFLVHNILLILKHISKIFKAKKAVEIVVTSQYTISLRAGCAFLDLAASTEIEENEMLVYENREVEINNFEVEDKLLLFLNSVLNCAENMISAGTTNMNEIQTCLLVVDRTISLLRLIIQEVDEVDKQEWHTIESCFELILQSLHNYVSELARRSTTLTTEYCNVECNGR